MAQKSQITSWSHVLQATGFGSSCLGRSKIWILSYLIKIQIKQHFFCFHMINNSKFLIMFLLDVDIQAESKPEPKDLWQEPLDPDVSWTPCADQRSWETCGMINSYLPFAFSKKKRGIFFSLYSVSSILYEQSMYLHIYFASWIDIIIPRALGKQCSFSLLIFIAYVCFLPTQRETMDTSQSVQLVA